MSTITDPIMLNSTGQAIKNSIDLLSANINRTASNIPYDNNLTIKGKIDEIDAKTADDIPYSSGVSVKDKIDTNSDEVYELNLLNGWSGQIFVTVNRNGRITCLSGALIYTANVTSPIFARAYTLPQNAITNRGVPVATQGGAIYNAVGGTDVIGFGQDSQGWYATLNSQDHNVVMNAVYGRA